MKKKYHSRLYEVTVVHKREHHTHHLLKYTIFMFYLDLDEIPYLQESLHFFSYNRFNLYSLYDKDHFYFFANTLGVRENINRFFEENHLERPDKVFLLTNLRFLGYVFNPVSFYYCYKDGRLSYVLAEVNNTFHEQKPILIPVKETGRQGNLFYYRDKKNFYVSPFVSYDSDLLFYFTEPGEKILMRVDSGFYSNEKKEHHVIATLAGSSHELSDGMLWKLTLRYPFVPWKVIAAIHYHALLLWLKKVPYKRKSEVDRIMQEKQETLTGGKL